MRQSPWRQKRAPPSAQEGGSIADALSRLQQGPPPESKLAAQQVAPLESRSSIEGGTGRRGSPRPFGRNADPARRDRRRSRQSESEAVRVAVRVRPMSEREAAAGLQKVVSVDDGNALSVVDPTAFSAALALERDGHEKVESSMWAKRFSFDRCFGEEDSDSGEGQEKVFDEIGAAVIDQAFSGYNATVFAYGQTGSGKSYTMMGSGAALDDNVDPEDHGLIPRVCSGIFERVDQMEQEAAFRGPYIGSRIGQGHGADEPLGGRETGGVGGSSLPRNGVEPERPAGDGGGFNTPTTPTSSSRGTPAAAGGASVEDPTSYAGAVDAPTHTEFAVEVSYLEIYNESLRDLFNPATPAGGGGHGGNSEWVVGVADSGGGGGGGGCVSTGNGLRLREDPSCGTYVEGLTSIAVSSWDEMSQLLTYGGSERTVAATNANDWSSRSHAVFTLTLRQTSEALSPTGSAYESWEACSSVNLVDLAGSERVSHTGATGLRLQEAGSINRSLAALSDVIKALSEAQRRRPGGTGVVTSPRRHRSPGRGGRGVVAATVPRGFVPYRNSVLTRLLKESLGGNSRTVMLACVSPCDAHYEETLGTLRYAERAKRVRTRAVANARRGMPREGTGPEQAALVERLSAQICELKQQLAEATTTAIPPIPMSPTPSPGPPGGGVGTPGGDADLSSPGGFAAPVQTAGGQGYIYVVDPALHVEIERLRETVADRERVIEDMGVGEHHNLHARNLSTAQPADGRDSRGPKQGGGSTTVGEPGSLSTRSEASGRVASSPSSQASESVSGSSSACSGRLSIVTPPRAAGARGLDEAMANQDSSRHGEENETPGEKGSGESGMRLLNLNQDPMFSECMSFLIREDGVTVVGSAEDADVRLAGDDVLPRHAVINFGPDGNAVLTPLSGASVHINGIALSAGVEASACRGEAGGRELSSPGLGNDRDHCGGVLWQDYRVLFGSRHFFRIECGGSLPSAPGSCSNNIRSSVGDGGPSAVETKPVKIDWDFAQRELRDATMTIKNDSFNEMDAESTTEMTTGDGLVEQESDPDVDENASAKSDVPKQQKKHIAQQLELPEKENRLKREGDQGGDAPSPDGGSVAAAPGLSGSSETTGEDVTPPCPGAPSGETSPARPTRSEENSQTAPVSTPGAAAAEAESTPSNETTNKGGEDRSAQQAPDDFAAPMPSIGVGSSSPTPVLPPEPSSECDSPLATATTVHVPPDEGTPPHKREVADTPTVSGCDTSPAMAPVVTAVQNAEPQDAAQDATPPHEKGGAIPTEAELPNADRDERGPTDRRISKAGIPHENRRQSQGSRTDPPSSPQPLPPPPLRPPSSLKAGEKSKAELSASSKAIHVNRATLMELQRARDAWRGAEGELERSQEERDELRATLQTVQEQARERRRSDRKQKRELDKEKSMAENRARALEADRDRLRQMLSRSDEEVADLRRQLQKAQSAAFDAATAATAAASASTNGPNPSEGERGGEAQSQGMVGLGPVSAKQAGAEGRATFQRHPSGGRGTSNSTAGSDNFDEAGKSSGGGGWQVRRASALPVVPNQIQNISISGRPEEDQTSRGDEEKVVSGPRSAAESRQGVDSPATGGEEPRALFPTSIPRHQPGLQQQRHREEQQRVQPPHQQEPHEQEQQQQQQTLQAEERTSRGAAVRYPSNRRSQPPDAVTFVVESGNNTPKNDDANNPRSAYDSGDSISTPSAQKPAMGTNANTTTTTIVITSGGKVSNCFSATEDQSLSVEEQRRYDSGGVGGGGGAGGGRKSARNDSLGDLTGEGSEEEELAGAGAAIQSAGKEQQQLKMDYGDDDLFLKESRSEIEAARRLLDRHSVTTATATREEEAVRADVATSAAVVEGRHSTVEQYPNAGSTRDPRIQASAQNRVAMSPTTRAVPKLGGLSETEDAIRNTSLGRTRPRPSGRSAGGTASGREGADGDFYRAALSTHISFIATTAADDPPPSLELPDERSSHHGGSKPAGGVGEACRALQGDVAEVRQRLEAIQSKFSREEEMSGGIP